MADFLHGIETIEVADGPRTVTEVKTAVIGLVGIAPKGPKNVLTLVKNDTDAAQFGSPLPGFDIPQALNIIFGFNAGTVIVVNVYDEATHASAVVAEQHSVVNGGLALAFAPVNTPVLKKADGTATTYVAGADYTIDDYGRLTVIAGRIPENEVIKFDYKKLNPVAVLPAHIIGTVTSQGRTGIKLLELTYSLFGFRPKILLVPGRSGTKTIGEEMISAAEKFRAIALIDGTLGDSVNASIAARGDATKAFGTSSKRAVLLYPYVKGYDASKDTGADGVDTNTDYPYSMFYAGVVAATDNLFGYWFSPSNYELRNATGLERLISANPNDPTTESNYLNAAGIVTVFNSFGTGFRAWGNHNASFPTNTQTDNFISLLRTFDVLHESLELASMQYQDKPLTSAVIADIKKSGNDFTAVLVARGALTPGSRVVFNRSENSNEQLAAGQVTFTIIKDGPSPAERITYRSVIDISLKTRAIV